MYFELDRLVLDAAQSLCVALPAVGIPAFVMRLDGRGWALAGRDAGYPRPMANDQIEIKSEGWNAYIETPIRRLTALMVRRFLTPLPLRARSDHAEHQE